jgi:hypothetical protein
MILIRKIYTLVAGLALMLCLSTNTYSDAEEIAAITDSLGKNMASQNWDAVDGEYHQLYLAYQDEYGAGSRQALAMAKALGDWIIQAYRSQLLSKDADEVINDASGFFTGLIEDISEQQGANASDLIDPLYAKAMTEYHLFQLATKKPVDSYNGSGPEVIKEEVCVDSEDRGGSLDCSYVDVPSRDYLDSQAFAKTQETTAHWEAIGLALNQVAEICRVNQYLLDEAEAKAHIGDYHLYGGEGDVAMDYYSEAYQLLANNMDPGAGAWAQRLFATTTVVPSLSTSFPGAAPTPITTNGMTYGFSIKSDGKAENVEVRSGASRNNRPAQQNTIGIISGATFRPHFDENGVVESASVEI